MFKVKEIFLVKEPLKLFYMQLKEKQQNLLYFSDDKTHLKSFNFLKNQQCVL